MTEEEKQLLDLIEKTRRIKKDIKSVREQVKKNDFLIGFVASIYNNAQINLDYAQARLEAVKEVEVDDE